MKKVCIACHGKIKENKEKYVHVEDYNRKELKADNWWHLDCFKRAMNRDLKDLERLNHSLLKKAGHIINSLPDDFKEGVIYEV